MRPRTILSVVATFAVLGAGVAVAFAARGPSSPKSHAVAGQRWGKCPTMGDVLGGGTVEEVIAAARRVVIDHKVEFVQQRRVRLNAGNTPVIESVALGELPPLPGERTFEREAVKRCGAAAKGWKQWAWAVVFSPTWGVMCCEQLTVFVIRTKNGWRVF